MTIDGSMLHDMVSCERRVRNDHHADVAHRDAVNQFVQLLWRGGSDHEAQVLAGLGGAVIDLRETSSGMRANATQEALRTEVDFILGARLEVGDLVGMPDLLRRVDGVWHAGDVKSGDALEADGKRPRLAYGVQVALYAAMMGELGVGNPDIAFVISRDGTSVDYDLTAGWSREGRSIAELTADLVVRARSILDGSLTVRGALSATCKLCWWRSHCSLELRAADDLTQIAGLGRALRDVMLPVVTTVGALAHLEVEALGGKAGRTGIPGLGPVRLLRFRDRARLLATPGSVAYARYPLGLVRAVRELHFDIESDPSRGGFVYLHGIVERIRGIDGDREKFVPFVADGPDGEGAAFAEAFAYLTADPDATIYYYSKFERSAYRDLQRRHPDVCDPAAIERLFDPKRAIDLLFDVVMPGTEWPTNDLSIKTLAKRLGFSWRDTEASGANSIAWYDEFVRSGDPAVMTRILEYNQDDCRATAVLLDGLIALPVRDGPPWPPSAPGGEAA